MKKIRIAIADGYKIYSDGIEAGLAADKNLMNM
jgi:hypothetical protein